MNGDGNLNGGAGSRRAMDLLAVAARLLLAAVFLYLGLSKALHPVEFLKLVRQYGILTDPLLLNLVAALLPWFEVFCGLLLLLGVAVRGAAVLLLAMLIPFSALIFLRAWSLGAAGAIPLCAVRFDCGCGGGEVLACRKLAENTGLALLAAWLVWHPRLRFCLRASVLASSSRG